MFVGTKNVPISQNKVHKVPIAMEAKCSVAHYDIDKCLPCMALCGLIWPHLALYGLMWPHMVFLFFTAMAMCVRIQLNMALCDLVWSCMALYGLLWSFMAEYRIFSRSYVDPN